MLRSLPNNDDAFAESIARSRVVLGESGYYSPTPIDPANPAITTPFALRGGDPTPFLLRFPGMIRNVAPLEKAAAGRGIRAIIAGAGGAAHLPGMIASVTTLPVIGVPVPLAYLDGMDSLLSIVQMPAGIPVATVSINGAKNAGLLAARILATSDTALAERVEQYARDLEAQVQEKNRRLKESL